MDRVKILSAKSAVSAINHTGANFGELRGPEVYAHKEIQFRSLLYGQVTRELQFIGLIIH